jgi:hypothetical protein
VPVDYCITEFLLVNLKLISNLRADEALLEERGQQRPRGDGRQGE